MALPDDQAKRLKEQADDLDKQAEKKKGREKEAFKAAAKLLRDPGLKKGLDAQYDEADAEAITRPVDFFRKHGADLPEGVDIRHREGG
jgi:hypothetical protein